MLVYTTRKEVNTMRHVKRLDGSYDYMKKGIAIQLQMLGLVEILP